MDIKLETKGVFIPKYNNNLELPENEQSKFHWRCPTGAEKAKIIAITPRLVGGDVEVSIDNDYIYAVKTLITKVENLSINGKLLKTGKDLIDTIGASPIFQEVAGFLIAKIKEMEIDPGNSGKPAN
jgi:hypothetical protein